MKNSIDSKQKNQYYTKSHRDNNSYVMYLVSSSLSINISKPPLPNNINKYQMSMINVFESDTLSESMIVYTKWICKK